MNAIAALLSRTVETDTHADEIPDADSDHGQGPSPHSTREMERRIVTSLVDELLSHGCSISVIADDGARIRRSYEREAILPAMMSTDAESIYVYGPGYNSSADHTVKAVFLVYGNDGYDVINDYSSSLAPLIVRTLALVNELTSAGR